MTVAEMSPVQLFALIVASLIFFKLISWGIDEIANATRRDRIILIVALAVTLFPIIGLSISLLQGY